VLGTCIAQWAAIDAREEDRAYLVAVAARGALRDHLRHHAALDCPSDLRHGEGCGGAVATERCELPAAVCSSQCPLRLQQLAARLRNGLAVQRDYRFGFVPAQPVASRVVSSILVHGGWQHLALNMAVLAIVARAVERRLGPPRLALLYFATGGCGLLGEWLWTSEPWRPIIGSSAAVAGVVGVRCAWALRSHARHPVRAGVGAAVLVSVVIGGDAGEVAMLAHVTGFVAGLGAGLLPRPALKGLSWAPPRAAMGAL
jgi:membrane associated rhomboid family serine protease